MTEHPFFRELQEAIEGLQDMTESYNPQFQTEARPAWTNTPNPQQQRLHNLFMNTHVTPPQNIAVDVNHQVIQELPSAPEVSIQPMVYVLIAHYDQHSTTPPDVVGVYETREKAKAMFDLLEKYRDETITFYLIEKEVQ